MNRRWLPSLAIASFVVTCGLHAAAQTAPDEERVTRSSDGLASDHAADELRDPTTFETLRVAPGDVSRKPRVGILSNKGFASPQAVYGDSYIYDATVDVFSDRFIHDKKFVDPAPTQISGALALDASFLTIERHFGLHWAIGENTL